MEFDDIALRFGLAAVGGLILGIDREVRSKATGLRTNAIVSVSAAMVTISALILYRELNAEGAQNIDPLRVVQGLAQAIGFIAAGAIFVSRGDVQNLTSAANLWLAAAVGIAAGAGQIELALLGIAFGVFLVTALGFFERWVLRR